MSALPDASRSLDAAAASPSLVRLLEAEPDFGRGIAPAELSEARRRTVVPLVTLPPGPWSPLSLYEPDSAIGPFAVLVVNGLVARHVALSDRVATQLAGPGDVLPLRAAEEILPPTEHATTVASTARLAVFDAHFLAATQRWPWLAARVIERSTRWADRGAVLQAISQLGRVDLRVLAVLWHLAERWGRMNPDGVFVPIKLTHEALGRLVGAQRPTVTLALRDLRERGIVDRRGDGWVLDSQSCELLASTELVQAVGAGVSVVPSGADSAVRFEHETA